MINTERLKDIRENLNLTQADISKQLNISSSAYARYENENDIFPIKHLISVCDYLNISIDYILGLNDKIKYSNAKKAIDKKLASLRLKEFRKDNKITQDKLSSILNCSYGTIAGYESGRYIIATPFLYTICKKYDISADYLLGKIDTPKYLK